MTQMDADPSRRTPRSRKDSEARSIFSSRMQWSSCLRRSFGSARGLAQDDIEGRQTSRFSERASREDAWHAARRTGRMPGTSAARGLSRRKAECKPRTQNSATVATVAMAAMGAMKIPISCRRRDFRPQASSPKPEYSGASALAVGREPFHTRRNQLETPSVPRVI